MDQIGTKLNNEISSNYENFLDKLGIIILGLPYAYLIFSNPEQLDILRVNYFVNSIFLNTRETVIASGLLKISCFIFVSFFTGQFVYTASKLLDKTLTFIAGSTSYELPLFLGKHNILHEEAYLKTVKIFMGTFLYPNVLNKNNGFYNESHRAEIVTKLEEFFNLKARVETTRLTALSWEYAKQKKLVKSHEIEFANQMSASMRTGALIAIIYFTINNSFGLVIVSILFWIFANRMRIKLDINTQISTIDKILIKEAGEKK